MTDSPDTTYPHTFDVDWSLALSTEDNAFLDEWLHRVGLVSPGDDIDLFPVAITVPERDALALTVTVIAFGPDGSVLRREYPVPVPEFHDAPEDGTEVEWPEGYDSELVTVDVKVTVDEPFPFTPDGQRAVRS
jgi:hypothetical protein